MGKKITIIIPNWNGLAFLENCLSSLRQQTYRNYNVIIIDNGSSDGSVEYIRGEYPNINLIECKLNRGFAAAVNLGIKKAKGDYVFLLNNDTELENGCLKNLIETVRRTDASILACKMLYYYNRQLINDAGDIYSIYGYAFQEGNHETSYKKFIKERYVFSACAGAALYKRELFDEIGFFDEDFFAYLEDVDFGFRAQLAGHKCLFVPSAVVYHVEGGTSKKLNNFAIYQNLRNNLFLITKNFPIALLIICFPFIFVYQIRNMLVAIEHKYFKTFLKIYSDYFVNFSNLMKKRKTVQRSKKVSNFYIYKILSKRYPFSIVKSLLKYMIKIFRYPVNVILRRLGVLPSKY